MGAKEFHPLGSGQRIPLGRGQRIPLGQGKRIPSASGAKNSPKNRNRTQQKLQIKLISRIAFGGKVYYHVTKRFPLKHSDKTKTYENKLIF
jgi:hypothetical protein